MSVSVQTVMQRWAAAGHPPIVLDGGSRYYVGAETAGRLEEFLHRMPIGYTHEAEQQVAAVERENATQGQYRREAEARAEAAGTGEAQAEYLDEINAEVVRQAAYRKTAEGRQERMIELLEQIAAKLGGTS